MNCQIFFKQTVNEILPGSAKNIIVIRTTKTQEEFFSSYLDLFSILTLKKEF